MIQRLRIHISHFNIKFKIFNLHHGYTAASVHPRGAHSLRMYSYHMVFMDDGWVVDGWLEYWTHPVAWRGGEILLLACPHQEGGGQSWKTTTHVLQCSDKVLLYKLTSMLILFSQKARPESKYHDAILVSGILLPHLVIPHEVPQITGIKLGLRMWNAHYF